MQWYYTKQGQKFGPVDHAELCRLAQQGQITPDDLVWNTKCGDKWVRASTVENLFVAPLPTKLPPVGVPPQPVVSASGMGLTHNRDLMRMARESLRTHWGLGVGVTALYWVIFSGVGGLLPFVGSLACLVISGPMSVGFRLVFLMLARRTEANVGQLFAGFKSFGTAFVANLLMGLFILLWSLLLIVPGIIAVYAYAMTFFIIADDPSVKPLAAIRRSNEMMRGNKWKLFCLLWRFFGWLILCILTLGIGFLWLVPYVQTTMAHFYDNVKSRK
ncbi:MAG: DUF975 family protein [Kiritimatiellia bacterium]